MAKKLTSNKAKEILHDKSVHGHPLTDKQRKFFGAIAGGAPIQAKKGWLEKYAEGGRMQEHQENYNDNTTSYPPGFVGVGYNTKGRNYSPAWGGQFQMGGKLTFLEPTSSKLPIGYANIPSNVPSSELAQSIGGEDGEPAFLIPTFKYGHPLEDASAEFRKTGEHLGGPFKTWQEADEWERNVRNPYVEKGQDIPTPLRRWGKDIAMGGSIPGSVGFTYARTQGAAPSNGPYAKKTKASAQNGTIHKKYLPEKVENWQEPKYVEGLNSEGHYGYSNGVINYDPNSEVENINNPWWLEHEKYHHLQTLSGRNPKERRQQEVDNQVNEMIKSNPGLQFIPKSKLISGSKPNEKGQKSFVGAGDRIYENPSTLEGEARLYEDYISSGGKSIFPKQENGGMTYYQNGLDWKPKMISKNGSVIEDDMGQWAHPGEITKINSNQITMKGVDYPVLGISDAGDRQMMYPDQEYTFKGRTVTEYPQKKKNGGWLDKYN